MHSTYTPAHTHHDLTQIILKRTASTHTTQQLVPPFGNGWSIEKHPVQWSQTAFAPSRTDGVGDWRGTGRRVGVWYSWHVGWVGWGGQQIRMLRLEVSLLVARPPARLPCIPVSYSPNSNGRAGAASDRWRARARGHAESRSRVCLRVM